MGQFVIMEALFALESTSMRFASSKHMDIGFSLTTAIPRSISIQQKSPQERLSVVTIAMLTPSGYFNLSASTSVKTDTS